MPEKSPPCKAIYDYYRIPKGARIEVWTEGDCKAFDTVGKLFDGSPQSKAILHTELCGPPLAGPWRFTVQPPKLYTIALFTRFRFQQTTQVILNLRIVTGTDGNGDPIFHSTPVRCSISGKQGDGEDERIFFLKTMQS